MMSDQQPNIHDVPLPTLPALPHPTKKRRRTEGDAAGGRAKLTLKDKHDIIQNWDQFPEQQNYAAVGRKYNVSRQCIRKVISNRELVLQDVHNQVPMDAKRSRVLQPDMAVLDEKVMEYINSVPIQASNMKRSVLPICMEALKMKATEIASALNIKTNKGRSTATAWQANNMWYTRFCNRHNFQRELLPPQESMDMHQGINPGHVLMDNTISINPIMANMGNMNSMNMVHMSGMGSIGDMGIASMLHDGDDNDLDANSLPKIDPNTSMLFVHDDSSVDSQN